MKAPLKFTKFCRLSVYLLLLTFSSCTDFGNQNPIPPKTKFNATVKMNGQPFMNISTNDCEELGGYQMKSINAIVITAIDPSNFNTLVLYVYYKDVSDLSPGRRLPILNVTSNALYGFTAAARDDATGQAWQTGMEGKVSGSLTVKSFDSATGLASFDVVFNTMLYQSGQLNPNRTASFSGTFENVPIFPDQDTWSDCNSANQGFDNNPGNANNPGTGNPNPGTGNPNNPGTGNSGTTNITFANKMYLPIEITFNGETKIIPFNGTVTFAAKAGTQATGSASCANKTTSGTQIGLKISWDLNYTFPSSGTLTVNIGINSSYFFLRVQNKSGKQINKLLVNYGLQSQTQDNIIIPADDKVYGIGYYKAFTNSNVRAENTTSNSVWSWTSLSLPFTENQSTTLVANP